MGLSFVLLCFVFFAFHRIPMHASKGASHGLSRIYRHAYFEHSDYVPLLFYSTSVFQEMQHRHQTNRLIHQCGTLIVDHCGTKNNNDEYVSPSTSIVSKSIQSANAYNIQVKRMCATELEQTYPCFNVFDPKLQGVLEPTGGFVCPELAIQLALRDAISISAAASSSVKGGGLNILYNTQVVSIEPQERSGRGFMVKVKSTSNSSECSSPCCYYTADCVIVTVGSWTSSLLPSLQKYLKVTRQIQAWFEPPIHRLHQFSSPLSPTWYLCRGEGQPGLYGIPCNAIMNPDHPTWYKVALHGRNDPIMDQKQIGEKNAARPVSPEELEELKSVVAQWISCAPDRFVHAIPCTYTSTDDGHFIVDSMCRHDNTIGSSLLCVAGLSGHGFKMVPALGKAVVDLAMDGVTSLPIKFLGLDRFKKE